jgi:hypothetical protein
MKIKKERKRERERLRRVRYMGENAKFKPENITWKTKGQTEGY